MRHVPPECAAQVAVLHGEVHTAHYAALGPTAWEALDVPWVELTHFDERTTSELIRGLADGRFHGLVLSTGALQSAWNQAVVGGEEFAAALEAAVTAGIGVLVLQQYLGAGRSFQLTGLPPALSGALTQTGGEFTTREIVAGTANLGMSEQDRTRLIGHLRETRADEPLYTHWEPDLPTRWRDLLTVPGDGQDAVVLGYSEVAGSRLFASALPLDRWGCWDLLRRIISRCVRPRGLAVIEFDGTDLASDADLRHVRDASVARGAFVVHFGATSPADLAWTEEPVTLFNDVIVAATPLSALSGLDRRALRSRAENGGSIVCRVEAPDSDTRVVRLGGTPFTVDIAEQLEAWLAYRLQDADSLTTTEFASLGILSAAASDTFADRGIIPLGLRRRALAATCRAAVCRRVDDRGCVDDRTLPTAATAASLAMLGISDGPSVPAMLEWLDARPDFHTDPQSQYYARLAGRSSASGVPEAPSDGDPRRYWTNLLLVTGHGDAAPAELIRSTLDAAHDDVTLALAVHAVLARFPHSDEVRAALVGAIGRLQRRFEAAMRAGSGTVEAVTLIGAALLRFGRDGDVLPLTDVPSQDARRWEQDPVPLQEEVRALKQALEEERNRRDALAGEAERRLGVFSWFAWIGVVLLVLAALAATVVFARWALEERDLEAVGAAGTVAAAWVAMTKWAFSRRGERPSVATTLRLGRAGLTDRER